MLTPPLTDLDYLKTVLSRYNITPERSRGQNFLICPEVVDATLAATATGPHHVTELGAGHGVLTQALLSHGCTVRAIESDKTLIKILSDNIPPKLRPNLDIQPGDIRHTEWIWNQPYQVIGNIPYNLSGLIIRRLTQLEPMPTAAILLVQQEVAQRLNAGPPHLSLIGLAVQLWSQPHQVLTVPASCFWPPPQVNSALVLFLPTRPALPSVIREAILAFARPLFQARRKQLLGTLTSITKLPRNTVAAKLKSLGISPTARPQEVSVEDWKKLYENVKRKK